MARNVSWFNDLAGSLGKYPWWAHAAGWNIELLGAEDLLRRGRPVQQAG